MLEGEHPRSIPLAEITESQQRNEAHTSHLPLSTHASPHNAAPTQTSASDWQAIQQVMDADEVLSLKVTGHNRGGLLVEWRSLRGFVPASQLVHAPEPRKPFDLSEFIGRSLNLRVIEIDTERNRLIFSERAAQVSSGTRAHLLSQLRRGDIVQGRVTNLCDFGAFVDLGGVEGLIHISELSWGRVNHPSDVLRRDQEVRVYVLEVDPAKARVALSMKRLHPDPWATVAERYRVGEYVSGTITNVVDFGAFACIEEGLEGLIHFSELAEGHFLHPRNVVAEGDIVRARILSIDGKARRLGLSLRLQ
ncbi:MAG: S1 RNA-binding domain-containing protein [Anaerolineae bacterium]|nr:S1 RNA-binding domain-containing protein [Anaerolineae bacterium]MDW8173038.1 S1 RNA-binding domain-containing protein [Anaerolineae bacterium]